MLLLTPKPLYSLFQNSTPNIFIAICPAISAFNPTNPQRTQCPHNTINGCLHTAQQFYTHFFRSFKQYAMKRFHLKVTLISMK